MSKLCWYGCTANEIAEINAISSQVLDPSLGKLPGEIQESNGVLIRSGYKLFLSMLTDLQDRGILVARRNLIIRYMSRHTILEFLQFTEDWELAFLSQISCCKSCTLEGCGKCRFNNIYITMTTGSAIRFYKALRQISHLLKKLRINRVDLEDQLSLQLRLDDAALNDRINWTAMSPVIDMMHSYILEWTSEMDLEFLPFRHGTGAVADRQPRKGSENWKDDLTFITQKVSIAARITRTTLPRIEGSGVDLPSRQVFVPKTAKTLRGICEESVSRQFFQQGVMRYWYRYILSKPFLRIHFPIHDQTVNQRLARAGSKFGILSTFDLSKASDSVSWKLVKRLFKGTKIYPWMIATRATSCEYNDGTVAPLNKFAPMGSALCFPTECYVFGAIIQVAIDLYTHRYPVHSICEDWSVYGDDCTFPVEISSIVAMLMQNLGFCVNTEKSYIQGPFRESCGADYLFGYDVTPFYVREYPVPGNGVGPDSLDRLVQYANHCYIRDLSLLRKQILSEIFGASLRFKTRENFNRVIFSKEGVPGCVWTDVVDMPRVTGYDRSLQVPIARCLVRKADTQLRSVTASPSLSLYRSLIELEWRHALKQVDVPTKLKVGLEEDRYRKQRTHWGLKNVNYRYLDV